MSAAGRAARAAVPASNEHETAIRDVAAQVAGPVLASYVLWVLADARQRGLDRLCFLARDGQVLHEIATVLAPRAGVELDLQYVGSSRRTWSFAAADATNLAQQDWLFNSFMRANAEDVCERIRLPFSDFRNALVDAGASLDPEHRADCPQQGLALRRFVRLPDVQTAVAGPIAAMRELVRDYAQQEGITSVKTGVIDAGWTGRMIGALTDITSGLPQPQVYFWGHEPRAGGWSDPRLNSFMYDTETGAGMERRVPDTPYIVESFCMSGDTITAHYRRTASGLIEPVPDGAANVPVQQWGLQIYRDTIAAFCAALELPASWHTDDVRDPVSALLYEFWINPTVPQARAWGAYPFDSDPLARATRRLAKPIDPGHLAEVRNGAELDLGDRAWLQGSLALSGAAGAATAQVLRDVYHKLGVPAPD